MNFFDFVDSSDDVLKPLAFVFFMSLFFFALTRRQKLDDIDNVENLDDGETTRNNPIPVQVTKILDADDLRYLKTLRNQLNGYTKSVDNMKNQLKQEEFKAIMRTIRTEVNAQQNESQQFLKRTRDQIRQKLNL